IQVLIKTQSRRHDLTQDVQNVEELRAGYQRQVNEFLDLPVSKLGPDSIVFPPRFIAGRMRRPISASASEIFKAYFHGAVAPIHSLVQREAQTCDARDVVRASGS